MQPLSSSEGSGSSSKGSESKTVEDSGGNEIKAFRIVADSSIHPWGQARVVPSSTAEVTRDDGLLKDEVFELPDKMMESLGFVDCDGVSKKHLSLEPVVSSSAPVHSAPLFFPDAMYQGHQMQWNNNLHSTMHEMNWRNRVHGVQAPVGVSPSISRVSPMYQHSLFQIEKEHIRQLDPSKRSDEIFKEEWPSLRSPSTVDDVCLIGMDGQYQPYCTQIISHSLNEATTSALTKLKNLQQALDASRDSPQAKNSSKGKLYYCSLKEVSKVVRSCKLIVIAPDIMPSASAQIKPVQMLLSVIEDAKNANVPYVFALSRRGIGQIFGKDKNMSIMALMSLDGIETEYNIMMIEAEHGRKVYRESRQQRNHRPTMPWHGAFL